ncbi:Haem peroxidase [Orpheovirus IHUMI-LCC2]|uniref:Haem peroxidase n=1 Tax=Orpheovirus IHUMI-LCC2 TaxID=2023057 RepID=A0A2I2L5A1_9VIRU|nr:Haem peroxidase [Orpheovirus IHUMI-LCC2]SNW62722.1 Haem peroxidase [Orpheovirus IHUMI-LCC2]
MKGAIICTFLLISYVTSSCIDIENLIYRTHDGSCNNLLFNTRGKVNNPFLRLQEKSTSSDVNARLISNNIAATRESLKNGKGVNTLEFMFGQFINHDVQSTTRSPAPLFISLPEGDMLSFLPGTPSINNQSYIIVNDTIKVNGEVINGATSWLDLSSIYGNNENAGRVLRANDGTLKTSSQWACSFPPPFFSQLPCNVNDRVTFDNLPPSILQVPELGNPDINFPPRPDGSGVMNSGDFRVNGNVALALLHTLFIREHNRLVTNLKTSHPTWNADTLYEVARKINIAQYQNIVFYEYLPTIMPQITNSQLRYTGYNPLVNADTSYDFDGVAFRYGHTAFDSYQARNLYNETFVVVPDWYLQFVNPYQDPTKFVFAGTSGPEPFLIPDVLSAARTMENVWYSLIYNEGGKIDTLVVDDLRNLGAGFFPIDLFAVDIVRARIANISNYVQLRNKWYSKVPANNKIYGKVGCPQSLYSSVQDDPVACFSFITSNMELAEKLKSVYGKVKYVDAVVGALAEDIPNNYFLPPTISNIIYDEYNRKRVGDRFWFELYPDLVVSKIRNRKFKDLLVDNFDIPNNFPFKNSNAFLVPEVAYYEH